MIEAIESLKKRKEDLQKEIELLQAQLTAKEIQLKETGETIDKLLNRSRCKLCGCVIAGKVRQISVTNNDVTMHTITMTHHKVCGRCFDSLLLR